MAVVQSKRKQGEMIVFTKTRELATYTITICSNEKNFPKRYRWCITSKIVEEALSIETNASKANSVFVHDNYDYQLRKRYQSLAIASTHAMLSMIDIAYRVFGIDGKRVAYWTNLIKEVQILLCNWKKSEEEKHEEQKD